jgi:hypothetical protein
MQNTTHNTPVTAPCNETQYESTGSVFTVRSYFTGKETLQDILKRLILREYERQISAK